MASTELAAVHVDLDVGQRLMTDQPKPGMAPVKHSFWKTPIEEFVKNQAATVNFQDPRKSTGYGCQVKRV